MKIAIYSSNNATTLKKILNFLEKNFPYLNKKIEFVLIDNEENIELRELTKKLNIKLYEKNIEGLERKSQYISDELLKLSMRYKIDYIFLFCDKILKGEILKIYKNKIINFHPSLLPSFKGLLAIDKALKTDVILLGNTAHFINEKVDDGVMIMQSFFPRNKFKEYEDVLNLQIFMFTQLLEWVLLNRIKIENQRCIILNAKIDIKEFVPNLENKKLIELYNKELSN